MVTLDVVGKRPRFRSWILGGARDYSVPLTDTRAPVVRSPALVPSYLCDLEIPVKQKAYRHPDALEMASWPCLMTTLSDPQQLQPLVS